MYASEMMHILSVTMMPLVLVSFMHSCSVKGYL